MKDRIEKSMELKAPLAHVWRASTDHRACATWLGVRPEPLEKMASHVEQAAA